MHVIWMQSEFKKPNKKLKSNYKKLLKIIDTVSSSDFLASYKNVKKDYSTRLIGEKNR